MAKPDEASAPKGRWHNARMSEHSATIAGAGIAGLACALALQLKGIAVRVLERELAFGEVGAGIQLGPNAMRRLRAWGVHEHAALRMTHPQALEVRRASDGALLGSLRLSDAAARYGAPYATVHRADLHAALWQSVQALDKVAVHLGHSAQWGDEGGLEVPGIAASATAVQVIADGVWSQLRRQVVDDGAPQWTGHVAYRALARCADLPPMYRRSVVSLWLGARWHAVCYPVRDAEFLNVAVLVQEMPQQPTQDWSRAADPAAVLAALGGSAAELLRLIEALPAAGAVWRQWALAGRAAVRGAHELVRDRCVLVGDAAHPMLPYLAQGAGMAIEDAQVLADALADSADPKDALQRYARQRWARVARVQARSAHNGRVFHWRGPLAWARDGVMRVGGEAVLDLPWLYSA